MIERKFVTKKIKEQQIEEFISQTLKNVGHSHTSLQRTPVGEKVVIYASRPGLVVGRKGENIKKLTNTLKRKFNLENPQIEIAEVEQPNLDAQIVAERIASTIERFGIQKFKAIGHKTMTDVMNAGALGIEIIISGKVPSARAKSWRFYSGYLKKCGNIATEGVKRAQAVAINKLGEIGVKVAIMPPGTILPDDIVVGKLASIEVKPAEKKEAQESEASSKPHRSNAEEKVESK
ncbi:30S ribosomal protein S3 [Candidatus Woesearchaeota archaeon]|nr:30S ribosomal protein S3 [Candidatus Woesearchaeota archaeon]